jgi:hypothetical protein
MVTSCGLAPVGIGIGIEFGPKTDTPGTGVSKEPLEQLRNNFPKRIGGLAVSHEG